MIEKLLLLKEKPSKNNIIYFIILIITITFLIISYYIKTYDCIKTTGIITCENNNCYIDITLSYDKIDILNQKPKIEYLNKEYSIISINYNEPYLNNNIAYQDIKLTTNLKTSNQIINFKILYNKQRIITKILDIL